MKQVRQDNKLVKLAQKNSLEEAKALLLSGRKKSVLGRAALKKSTDSLDKSTDSLFNIDTPETLTHVNVNYRDELNGYTALMYAVSNENVELATMLMHFSADVNVQDKKGSSPLHLSVFNSQSKLVQHLLSKGARVDVANQDGNTPLHVACQHYGIGDKFLLLKLLQAKPDVTAKNKDGATPLDLAAQYDKQEAVSMLLDYEPSLRCSERAFHEAAIRGNLGVLKLMLDYGIDPNVRDNKRGTTALHETCRYLRYDAAKLLLTYGADPEIADINDETPQIVLSAYPVEKIDRFLKLFQDVTTLPRQRPKYTETSPADRQSSASSDRTSFQDLDSDENSEIALAGAFHNNAAAASRLTFLRWSTAPVSRAEVGIPMPDFGVEGDAEVTERMELLVEEALVDGNNSFRLCPNGPDQPSRFWFRNISMLEEGTYTITVRSTESPSLQVSATVLVEKRYEPPVDLDGMFDELDKMLQFD